MKTIQGKPLPEKPKSNFNCSDLSDISHNRILNEKVNVSNFLKMLKIQYPDVEMVFMESIEWKVLHDVSLDWIAISTYNCK